MESGTKVEGVGAAPAGWYAVLEGVARPGDLAWDGEGWAVTTFYDWWQAVDGFWCVIREFVDGGGGI